MLSKTLRAFGVTAHCHTLKYLGVNMRNTSRVDGLTNAQRANFLGQFLGATFIIGYGHSMEVVCVNIEIQKED